MKLDRGERIPTINNKKIFGRSFRRLVRFSKFVLPLNAFFKKQKRSF